MASFTPMPAALAALALFTPLAVLIPLIIRLVTGPRAQLKGRLAALVAPRGNATVARGAGGTTRRSRDIKNRIEDAAAGVARRRVELRLRLDRAGLALGRRPFYAASSAAAFVAAAVYLVLGYPWYLAWAVLVVVGVGLPRKILDTLARRRQARFTAHFADAVDVIVRGIRSGLPVGECLNIVAREAAEPVADEFRLLVEGQRLGMTLKQALERSCRRMPTSDMKFFAIVLNLQQQTGGNLGETLSGLSDVLRQRKRMADKVRAMSSEARTTAMIIGSMPFLISLMIYIIDPNYIALLWTDATGKKIFYGGLLWMSIGVLIMRNMIRFEL